MASTPAIKYCFESAVAITLPFQLCSARYTVPQMKNNRRSASATIQSPRKYDSSAPNYQLLPRKCSRHYVSVSAIFNPLQTKNSVRIISAINPVTTENTDDSCLQMYCREAMHRHYRELTPWAVSKKKWDTKEDKGKSMMRALYVLRYAKRHVSG